MKYFFMAILAALIAASVFTYKLNPETRSEVPILYWMTDRNPAREVQVATFDKWLEKNGYPRYELRLDMVNIASDKVVIQAVSGVCGDIIGHTGGSNMRFRHAVGFLEDLTEWAEQLGFDPSQTYAAMRPEITIGGRQFAFPCNVYVQMLWVDRNTFRKYGLPSPERRWTFDEFADLGKRFVQAANTPGQPRRFFFTDRIDIQQMGRSLGLSRFNETMTACTLDDERMVRVLELKYEWTYEDHILPTLADQQSFATESGYGGSTIQLFNSGNYAMYQCGRYGLIQLREFNKTRLEQGRPLLDLDVVEPPHGGFPNGATGTRAAAIYKGGKNKNLAKYFLAYLASADYNMNIVRDADALPPNPKYTDTEAYRRPLPMLPDIIPYFPYPEDTRKEIVAEFAEAFYRVTDVFDRDRPLTPEDLPAPPRPKSMSEGDYTAKLAAFRADYLALIPVYKAEWGCHEAFSEAARDIAVPYSTSPFILNQVASRFIRRAEEDFMSHRLSAQEAAREMAARVNGEIQRTLEEDPKKQKLYDELVALQEKIDQRKAEGRRIPLEWISNPFHRQYYAWKGQLE